MKNIVLALLFASTMAHKLHQKSLPIEPEENTCINVRKDTGIEEPCNTPGNSAWDPDAPIQTAAELGLSEGFVGTYWFFLHGCGHDGYNLDGVEPSLTDVVSKELMFHNDHNFRALN